MWKEVRLRSHNLSLVNSGDAKKKTSIAARSLQYKMGSIIYYWHVFAKAEAYSCYIKIVLAILPPVDISKPTHVLCDF